MPAGRNPATTISASALVVGSMVAYRFVSRKIKQHVYPQEDSDLDSNSTLYFNDDVGLASGFSCFSEIDSSNGSLTTIEGEETRNNMSSDSTITTLTTAEGERDDGVAVAHSVKSKISNELPVAPSTPPAVVRVPSPTKSQDIEGEQIQEVVTGNNNNNNSKSALHDLDTRGFKSEIQVSTNFTETTETTTIDLSTPKQHNHSSTIHKKASLLLDQDVFTLTAGVKPDSEDEILLGHVEQQQQENRGPEKKSVFGIFDRLVLKVDNTGETIQHDDTKIVDCHESQNLNNSNMEDENDDDNDRQSSSSHFASLSEIDSATNSKRSVLSQMNTNLSGDTMNGVLGDKSGDLEIHATDFTDANEEADEIQIGRDEDDEEEEEYNSRQNEEPEEEGIFIENRDIVMDSMISDCSEIASDKIFIQKLDPTITIGESHVQSKTFSKRESSLDKTVSQSSDETMFDSEFSTPTTSKCTHITLIDFKDKLEVAESYSMTSEIDDSSTKSCGGSDLESELSDMDSTAFKSSHDRGDVSLHALLEDEHDLGAKTAADLADSGGDGSSVGDRLPSSPQNDESYVKAKAKFYEIINRLSIVQVDGDRVPKDPDCINWDAISTIWNDMKDTQHVQDVLQFRDEKQHANLLSWVVMAPAIPFDLFGRILFSFPDASKEFNRHGLTPLHCGVIHGASESIIQSLLWVNPEATKMKDLDGLTPLHVGMRYGAPLNVIQALLRTNPDAAKEKDEVGQTPLYVGLYAGAPLDVIEAVLQTYPGAANEKCYDDLSPLHFEMMHGAEPEIIQLLLEAYPNAAKEKDKFGQTPLHIGVRYGASPEVICLLLQAYPDATKEKEKNGLTPLHCGMSKRRSSMEVIQSLVEVYPEAAKEKDRYAQTPIHYGTRYGASQDALDLVRSACPKSPEEQMENMHARLSDMMGMLEGAYDSKDYVSGELFPR